MAGRPRANQLYKVKGSNTWRYYKKGFGTVDTGQVDRVMAERAMKGIPQAGEASIFQVPDEPTQVPTDPIRAALNTVAEQTAPADQDSFNGSVPGPFPPSDTPSHVRASPSPEPDRLSKPELAVLRKLSGSKREKIIGLLGTGASRLNALAVTMTFGIAGFKVRDDFVMTDDELEIVKLGYDMWLDDVLDQIELKPGYVILIGNALLAASLVPHLERKPKKPKVTPTGEGGDNGPASG